MKQLTGSTGTRPEEKEGGREREGEREREREGGRKREILCSILLHSFKLFWHKINYSH